MYWKFTLVFVAVADFLQAFCCLSLIVFKRGVWCSFPRTYVLNTKLNLYVFPSWWQLMIFIVFMKVKSHFWSTVASVSGKILPSPLTPLSLTWLKKFAIGCYLKYLSKTKNVSKSPPTLCNWMEHNTLWQDYSDASESVEGFTNSHKQSCNSV